MGKDAILGLVDRYVPGKVDHAVRYYFSVGEDRFTLDLTPTAASLTQGNLGEAHCVVKAHPDVFEALVLRGKVPGPLDIARGRFKTNDVALLKLLGDCFRR